MSLPDTIRVDRTKIDEYRRRGLWRGQTVSDDLDERAAKDPDRVTFSTSASSLTNAQLHKSANALASALWNSGVRPGAVISFQMPNWIEVPIIDKAAAMIDAIINPMPLSERESELGHILLDSGSKILFVPGGYGNWDYLET